MGPQDSTRDSRAKTVHAVLEKQKVQPKELTGEARRKALKDFLSCTGWHRGAEVDQLSREEADIIAARLVRRIQNKVSVPDDKAQALQTAFTDLFKRRFIRDPDKPEQTRDSQRKEELLRVAREHLDETGLAALEEVLRTGYRPQTGQQ
ncbi:MAG: hypothetical protein HYY24_14700 [Verrucomicrobia bacterium]|nr:hypothetical protein [Verrucomicrobiota bacterium]